MAPRKSVSEETTVEVVEEVAAEEAPVETVEVAPVEEPAPAVPPTQQGVNPLLTQKRVKGRPNNTWRLYYGNVIFDCVEGVEREFPEEVYAYLKKSGNIMPPNF